MVRYIKSSVLFVLLVYVPIYSSENRNLHDTGIQQHIAWGLNCVYKRFWFETSQRHFYRFAKVTVDHNTIKDDPDVLYPTKHETVFERYRTHPTAPNAYYVNGQKHVLEFSNFLKLLIDNKNEQALMPYVDTFCMPSAGPVYYWAKIRVKNLDESFSAVNCDFDEIKEFRRNPFVRLLHAKKYGFFEIVPLLQQLVTPDPTNVIMEYFANDYSEGDPQIIRRGEYELGGWKVIS